MSAVQPLVYNGEIIHQRDEMVSLTDMWKASGSDPARAPAEWQRSADAQRFIEFLAETHNMGDSHVIAVKRGKGGGTFAHWQVGLAYAKYLSPEFHMWCNTVVRERMEGRAALPAATHIAEEQIGQILAGVKGIVLKRSAGAIEDGVREIVRAIRDVAERHTEEHRHLFRQFREPASAVALHAARFLDVGGVYRLNRTSGPIPRRAKLSGDISRSLDSFCKRNGIVIRSASVGGREVTHWPREAVLEWLNEYGSDLIARHMRFSSAQLLNFPPQQKASTP